MGTSLSSHWGLSKASTAPGPACTPSCCPLDLGPRALTQPRKKTLLAEELSRGRATAGGSVLPLKPHFHLQAARGNATGSVGPSSDEGLSELSGELGRVTLEPWPAWPLLGPWAVSDRHCTQPHTGGQQQPGDHKSRGQRAARAVGAAEPGEWRRRAATPQAPAGLAPLGWRGSLRCPRKRPSEL